MLAKSSFEDWEKKSMRLEKPLNALRHMKSTTGSDMTWRQTVDKLAHKNEGYPRLGPPLGAQSHQVRGRNLLPRTNPKALSGRASHRNGWALSPSRSPERKQPEPQAADVTSLTSHHSVYAFPSSSTREPDELAISAEVRDALASWGTDDGLSMDDGRSVSGVSTQYDDDGQPISKLPHYMVAHPDPENDHVLDSPRRGSGKSTPLSRYTRAQTNQVSGKNGMGDNVIAPAWLTLPVTGILATALL